MVVKVLRTTLLLLAILIHIVMSPLVILVLGIRECLLTMKYETKRNLSPRMLWRIMGDSFIWIWYKRSRHQERSHRAFLDTLPPKI